MAKLCFHKTATVSGNWVEMELNGGGADPRASSIHRFPLAAPCVLPLSLWPQEGSVRCSLDPLAIHLPCLQTNWELIQKKSRSGNIRWGHVDRHRQDGSLVAELELVSAHLLLHCPMA
jgi:hypothetical protein